MNAVSGSYETRAPTSTACARFGGGWSTYASDQFGFDTVVVSGSDPNNSKVVHDQANFTGTQWELNGGVVASLVQQPGFFIDGDLGARFMHIEVVNLDEFKDAMPFFVPELGFTLDASGDVTRTRGRFSFEQSVPAIAGTSSSDIANFSDVSRANLDNNWRALSLDLGGSIYLQPIFHGTRFFGPRPLRPREMSHELAWRVAGQTSLGTRVIPQAEGVLGGLLTVRGYPRSIVSGDSFANASLEHRYHIPLNLRAATPWQVPWLGDFRPAPDRGYRMPDWDLVLVAFGDWGQVWNTDLVPGESNDTLFGTGPRRRDRRAPQFRDPPRLRLGDPRRAVRPGERRRHRAALLRDDAVLSHEASQTKRPRARPTPAGVDARHRDRAGPRGSRVAGPHQTGGNGKGLSTNPTGANVWVVKAENGAILKYSTSIHRERRDRPIQPPEQGNRCDPRAQPHRQQGPDEDRRCHHAADGTFMDLHREPRRRVLRRRLEDQRHGLAGAAGKRSDRNFERGVDHFTDLKGKVENAGKIGIDPSTIPETEPNEIVKNQIVTNAVSLVGREVLNSGNIDANGWIVMAAGRDVFIGRDQAGNGLLLRVEGGADAVFNKSAKGVTTTGSLNVASIPMPDTTDEHGTITEHPSAIAGRISLGAGDLYGTAIFNQGAIKAREIALQASNKGDVALAGQVEAGTVGITFGGDNAGKLVGAPGAPAPKTLKADILNLTATGAKGQVVVADRLELQRANAPNAAETTSVNVDQKAALTTSNLANLDIRSKNDPAKTLLNLTSDAGIRVDDRTLVTKTRLTLDAPATLIEGPRDPLVVEQLNLQSRFTQTERPIVTGEDRFNRSSRSERPGRSSTCSTPPCGSRETCRSPPNPPARAASPTAR
jgi:hypothetical protein